jgi:GNAT superfamily N-acetyltransferase
VNREPAEPVVLTPGDPDERSVAALLRRSEEYSRSLYPPESVHILPVDELRSPAVHFLVARDHEDGPVTGCGAVVLQPGGCAEVKRMFVDPAVRRRGVGARILGALEAYAHDAGARVVRLETGTSQPEAVSLYRRLGYAERGPFGDYRDDPLSVFMEKLLGDRDTTIAREPT